MLLTIVLGALIALSAAYLLRQYWTHELEAELPAEPVSQRAPANTRKAA